ncbi:hypothetical protein HDU76_005691 [Blyttiomyces sp. JEL0837]|nr:hypothetical protein HDU76_005691 [Blyttiomyces sp. JEL0837]
MKRTCQGTEPQRTTKQNHLSSPSRSSSRSHHSNPGNLNNDSQNATSKDIDTQKSSTNQPPKLIDRLDAVHSRNAADLLTELNAKSLSHVEKLQGSTTATSKPAIRKHGHNLKLTPSESNTAHISQQSSFSANLLPRESHSSPDQESSINNDHGSSYDLRPRNFKETQEPFSDITNHDLGAIGIMHKMHIDPQDPRSVQQTLAAANAARAAMKLEKELKRQQEEQQRKDTIEQILLDFDSLDKRDKVEVLDQLIQKTPYPDIIPIISKTIVSRKELHAIKKAHKAIPKSSFSRRLKLDEVATVYARAAPTLWTVFSELMKKARSGEADACGPIIMAISVLFEGSLNCHANYVSAFSSEIALMLRTEGLSSAGFQILASLGVTASEATM